MQYFEQLPNAQPIEATPESLQNLGSWIHQEVEDALSARAAQDQIWRELLRLYEGVPKNPTRNTPVENAPNTEITLGAIATDSIYAQSLDLLYTASPPVMARATNKKWVKHAAALQSFIDWGVQNEWNLRAESEHTLFDTCQLGTGVYYTPWVESKKKTASNRVVSRGPRIFTLAPEDFLEPGGAYHDHQTSRWCAMRTYLAEHELRPRAQELGWDTDGVMPVGYVGWVRSRRETLGRTTSSRRLSYLYEIYHIYCYYDIDGDDLYEDLLVIWDRTSRKVMKAVYNPFDNRPFDKARYQIRAHLATGLGVMEMLRPFQEEVTEIHNHRTLNVMLANARIWKGKTGVVSDNMRFWPNRVVTMDDPDSLKAEAMSDVYPSAAQAEAITISLAERRVGVNEMSMPRPSQVMGSRTPGITALSLLQQVNRRFTPAFDSMKLATSGAVRQCLYRYSERLLAGDAKAEDTIRDVLSEDEAPLVIELLKDPKFDQAVKVVMTASSAQANKEQDRQNAIMLVNLLGSYYERTLQLVVIASNPQTPVPVRDTAKKIAEAAGAIIERTIRTFDQIRDPATFIVDVETELDSMTGLGSEGLQGLGQIIAALNPGGENVPMKAALPGANGGRG